MQIAFYFRKILGKLLKLFKGFSDMEGFFVKAMITRTF